MKLTKNKLNQIIKEEIAKINENEPTNEEILEAIEVLSKVDGTILKENLDLFQPILEKLI
jgi:radical SAM superfamily enzyme with C-terminal helix-hairpin-helix motif